MQIRVRAILLLLAAILCSNWTMATLADDQAIRPSAKIQLFNGKNLDGLYTWLKDAKYEDPRKVFTVQDGMLHISGDGFGYLCTKNRYKDYHLVVEFRWGEATWASRKGRARDSGLIIHCMDPDGSFHGVFMGGIEAQMIEGGTGDFLVLPGKATDGSVIPASLTAEVTKDRDGETVWKKGAPRKTIPSGRINWYGRDPDWVDKSNFRGKEDVESPGKEWTRLDVICDGGHIQYLVNNKLVNEGFDSLPTSGKILIQTEGAELFVRRFELCPLEKKGK